MEENICVCCESNGHVLSPDTLKRLAFSRLVSVRLPQSRPLPPPPPIVDDTDALRELVRVLAFFPSFLLNYYFVFSRVYIYFIMALNSRVSRSGHDDLFANL